MTRAGLICSDVAPCGGRGSGDAGGGRAVMGGGRQKYTAATRNDRPSCRQADCRLPSCSELSRLMVTMQRKGGWLLCNHWCPTLTVVGSRSA